MYIYIEMYIYIYVFVSILKRHVHHINHLDRKYLLRKMGGSPAPLHHLVASEPFDLRKRWL